MNQILACSFTPWGEEITTLYGFHFDSYRELKTQNALPISRSFLIFLLSSQDNRDLPKDGYSSIDLERAFNIR